VTAPRIRRRFVDGPFGQIHIRDSGPHKSGQTPLICLHQSPKSSREFTDILPTLAETRRVIAIDNPGHGESDIPESEDEATIENYARSAWAALDELNIDQVHLYGCHTGSLVATEMAYQRPEKVEKILLVSATVLTEAEVEHFKTLFRPIPLDEAGTRFQTLWDKALKYRGAGMSLEHLAYSFVENFRSGEAYEWGHQAAFNYSSDFQKRIETLEHPIYVINPADLLHDITPRVMPFLKNGTLIDIPDWEFGFMTSKTEEATALIEKLLSVRA